MYKHDWEYDFLNPISTTNFFEKVRFHATGHKRNIKDDWVVCLPLGLFFCVLPFFIPYNDECIMVLVKAPLWALGAILLALYFICKGLKADKAKRIEKMREIQNQRTTYAEIRNQQMRNYLRNLR